MTDIDVPMRYATPAADRTERDGSVGLVVLLALALAVAAVGLAMVSREMAEPFVLAILAGLAVVGVFCLFAGAVGILHFGGRHARNDVTKAFVDNLPQGALIADSAGRVLYANESYRDLLGLETEANVPAPDRAFAGNPHLAECIFRLSRAAQQGRSLKEEFRLPPPGEAEDETGVAPRWFRISVQPMPPDPRSGRKGALTVWQVDEITMDRAREEASFAKVQAAIAYLDSAPAGFFTADADGTIEYLNATLAQWLGLDLSEVAGRALKLEEIMSADSAALIARSGRGQSQGATRRFDIDLVKADGTSLAGARPASPASPRIERGLGACARLEPRPRRGRGGRRRRAPICAPVPFRADRHRHGRWRRPHQRDQRRLHAIVRRRRRGQESAAGIARRAGEPSGASPRARRGARPPEPDRARSTSPLPATATAAAGSI